MTYRLSVYHWKIEHILSKQRWISLDYPRNGDLDPDACEPELPTVLHFFSFKWAIKDQSRSLDYGSV